MNERYPTFEEAALQFRQFLSSQAWPSRLVWTRPGDLVVRGRRVQARAGSEGTNERHARDVFARGVSAALGVLLEGVCHDTQRTYARVARPVDADAAERALYPNGLKLSVAVSPPPVDVVATRLAWWLWARFAQPWPPKDADIET